MAHAQEEYESERKSEKESERERDREEKRGEDLLVCNFPVYANCAVLRIYVFFLIPTNHHRCK